MKLTDEFWEWGMCPIPTKELKRRGRYRDEGMLLLRRNAPRLYENKNEEEKHEKRQKEG